MKIAVTDIDAWEYNPRGRGKFSEEALRLLGEDLLRAGQNHAVTVRAHPGRAGRWQLADGERRWRAALLVGIVELEAVVRELDDAAMWRLALSSGREGSTLPLSPMEEARGYRDAMAALGLTQQAVAEFFGGEVTQVHVSRRLALLDLPEVAREALESGELGLATALEIARVPDGGAREELAALVLRDRATLGVLPLERVRAHVMTAVYRPLAGAPFSQEEAGLGGMGACAACEHANRAMARRALCMRPSCFEAKVAAVRARVAERERAKGRRVLSEEENRAVFPPGATGVSAGGGFVLADGVVPRDLLKREVANPPEWAEVCGEVAERCVGFDQGGRVVELYDLKEALLAADEREVAIFNPDTLRRYNLDKGAAKLKRERRARLGSGGEEVPAPKVEVEAWDDRAAAWIGRALEAAPELPPGLRSEGLGLVRERGLRGVAAEDGEEAA